MERARLKSKYPNRKEGTFPAARNRPRQSDLMWDCRQIENDATSAKGTDRKMPYDWQSVDRWLFCQNLPVQTVLNFLSEFSPHLV